MDSWAVVSEVSLHPRPGRLAHPAALLALGLLSSGAGCSRGPAAFAQGPGGIPVKIEVARSVSVNDTTEYIATLKSRDSAVIMPQVEGQITEILVRSGDRVSAGQPLMQIDPAKQQATVKSQEDTRAARLAGLQFAKQQYERVNGLFAAGVTSRQDLDQAKSALDAAQAELQSLDAQVREQEVQLHYYRVVAPTGGIVGDVPVRVEAGIDNPKGSLRTSQFIRARIVWGPHEGPVVPVLAVSRISGQYFAFVAEEKNGALVARQRPLKVGEMTGNGYVVREGIRPGDRVIVSGTQFLVDGAPVTPQS